MFAISTARDFFQKAKDDLILFESDIANSSKAMNCILSVYHLHEWVWSRFLKATVPLTLRGDIVRDYKAYLQWLEAKCPHFKIIQELANGTKHCSPVHSTGEVAGYGRGPFGIGPWGQAYLLIDLGPPLTSTARYLVAHDVLRQAFEFWDTLFTELNIP